MPSSLSFITLSVPAGTAYSIVKPLTSVELIDQKEHHYLAKKKKKKSLKKDKANLLLSLFVISIDRARRTKVKEDFFHRKKKIKGPRNILQREHAVISNI